MPGALIALTTACLFDLIVGDPPNFLHPVVAMGKFIQLSQEVYKSQTPLQQFLHGLVLVLLGGILFSLPWVWILNLASGLSYWLRWMLVGFFLKPVFAFRRLVEAGREIDYALRKHDLPEARRLTTWHLVSRDTVGLSAGQVASAAIESLAENLTDSFFAPIFFFSLFGLPFAWFYRFVNTADAVIGYRTPQFEYLGKFAAKLDDVFNWLPARIAAITLVLAAWICGYNPKSALDVMRSQSTRTSSPNAGWTMAAAAGALDVRLEKVSCYQLNEAQQLPTEKDIQKAGILVSTAALISLLINGGIVYAISALV